MDVAQNNTQPGDPTIAIVGGSIVGPAMALMLRKAGFNSVAVYEATPQTVPQAGGVIGLDMASLATLDAIDVDQQEIVPFDSAKVVRIAMRDGVETGRSVTEWSGRNTSWTLVNKQLLNLMPDQVYHAGQRLVGIDTDSATGRARLQLKSGTGAAGAVRAVAADLVLLADGRKSTGRRLLDPQRELKYAGYTAWRGQTPGCPPDLVDYTRYEPDGALFHMFPIEDIDAGADAGMRPVATDWTLYLDTPAEQYQQLVGGLPTTRTYTLPHHIGDAARQRVDDHAVANLPARVAEMVRRSDRRSAAPVLDIDPPDQAVYRIGESAAVLMGDALAPVRPHTGRGANEGLDQVASLTAALVAARSAGWSGGAPPMRALEQWQTPHLRAVASSLQLGRELAAEHGLGQATGARAGWSELRP